MAVNTDTLILRVKLRVVLVERDDCGKPDLDVHCQVYGHVNQRN